MDAPPRSRLPRWGFAVPGRVRDWLTGLALEGTKTATTGLLIEFELDGEALPVPGERQVLVDSAARPVAIVETTGCRVVRLADVDDAHARDEGEGFEDAAAFRVAHVDFWNGFADDLRDRLGDPGWTITADTPVVMERFRVVERLDVPPGSGGRGVRRATRADLPALAGVLARAFHHDPMVRWCLVTDDDLGARIRGQFEAVDAHFVDAGWMWQTDDGLGVACIMAPPRDAAEQALFDGDIPDAGRFAPDGGARNDRFWAWVAEHEPPEPHWLLDQIAVEPEAQGRGVGAALLRHAVGLAQADGRPITLETGVEANVARYERFGFRVVESAVAPDGGPRIWFMRRDPG